MQASLPLRRAVPSDAPAVRALTRAAYEKWIPIIHREPLPMTADYDRALAEHLIDLWEEDQQLLALIEMIPAEGYLLIENLAVRPDQQGKGLGDRLLHHAEDVAVALGFSEIQLYTNAAFTVNIAFYARRGYQEYQRAPIPAGGIVVYMKKTLTPTD
ncbi:MAG: GNAT family N-acetyltransferase [Chloroflexi bacterium]|nr:GNAT family N-acetyltransferase [Chloroflexota bacterium]